MALTLTRPSEVAAPVRDAGGDNEVPRDDLGRPRIITPCPNPDCVEGRTPSLKKPAPATIKCAKCNGEGRKLVSYTRTTTFIDVIEDKSNLQAWGERMVLIGVARDPKFLDGVGDLDIRRDEKPAKDELNRKAQAAKLLAGSEEKADRGTHLHGLSELVDQHMDLPVGISFEDVVDMDSYRRATHPRFEIVHMEKLVVHDEYKIGGTPDRVSKWVGEEDLIAPDGTRIERDELLITDLKTGSVEYGGLKMAMQLSIYSRSELYDHETGARTPFGNINQRWGIIMHLAAGSGETTLYWADLTLGWEAVEVARAVRSLRSRSRHALGVLAQESTVPVAVGV